MIIPDSRVVIVRFHVNLFGVLFSELVTLQVGEKQHFFASTMTIFHIFRQVNVISMKKTHV